MVLQRILSLKMVSEGENHFFLIFKKIVVFLMQDFRLFRIYREKDDY